MAVPASANQSRTPIEFPNEEITVLASAVRTATVSSSALTNNGRGANVVFDFTVETDAGASLVVSIQGYDSTSGKWYTILSSAARVDVGTTVMSVYPGAVAVANLVANAILPKLWRVTVTHADVKSVTYSVGAAITC